MTKEEFVEEAVDALKADPEITDAFEINNSGGSILLISKETFEDPEARLKREDYERRNLEAIASREEILRRNKVLAPDEEFSMDPDAAVRQRCCF